MKLVSTVWVSTSLSKSSYCKTARVSSWSKKRKKLFILKTAKTWLLFHFGFASKCHLSLVSKSGKLIANIVLTCLWEKLAMSASFKRNGAKNVSFSLFLRLWHFRLKLKCCLMRNTKRHLFWKHKHLDWTWPQSWGWN